MKKIILAITLVISVLVSVPVYAQPPLVTHLLPVSCRLLDTRINGDGPIQPNEIRIFSVDPLFSSLQGGASNCGVPENARGVKITLAARPTTAVSGGYIRVFNADASVLGTYSSLTFQGSVNFISNRVDVPVSGNLLVAIYSPQYEAHAIVDLVGYYTELVE